MENVKKKMKIYTKNMEIREYYMTWDWLFLATMTDEFSLSCRRRNEIYVLIASFFTQSYSLTDHEISKNS